MSHVLQQPTLVILPKNVEESHREFFQNHSLFNTQPPQLTRFRNVFVSSTGLVFKNANVLAESVCSPLFLKKYTIPFFLRNFFGSLYRIKFQIFKKGVYIIVHDEWSSNYFHWLTDVLPRLYIARFLLQDTILILPDTFKSSYHHHTIKRFNIVNIKRADIHSFYFVKQLIFPSHLTAPGGYYNPQILRAAVNFLTVGCNKNIHRGKKIYISRKNAYTRRIVNEAEVIALLEKEGFSIVLCEELSFEEQVSIFSNAAILIAVHGAGLTNMAFMSEGSSVLELRKLDDSDRFNCYFRLSAVFNHRYFYQLSQQQELADSHFQDIYVDTKLLKHNIGLLGS